MTIYTYPRHRNPLVSYRTRELYLLTLVIIRASILTLVVELVHVLATTGIHFEVWVVHSPLDSFTLSACPARFLYSLGMSPSIPLLSRHVSFDSLTLSVCPPSSYELDILIARRLPAPFSPLPRLLRRHGFSFFLPSPEPPSVRKRNNNNNGNWYGHRCPVTQ